MNKINKIIEAFDGKPELRIKKTQTNPNKFNARLTYVEIKENDLLVGPYGEGETEEEAITNLYNQYIGKILVYGAYTNERKEIMILRSD